MHEQTASSNQRRNHRRIGGAVACAAALMATVGIAAPPGGVVLYPVQSGMPVRDTRTSIGQIETEVAQRARDTASDTDAAIADEAAIEQLGPRESGDPVAQVAPAATPVLSALQVGTRDLQTFAGPQLSTGDRSADGVAPLSNPRQSRPQAVVRLTGNDSCDPAIRTGESDVCARAIETRSEEYRSASAPVLSAEQRILIDQQQREAASDPATIARRLGRGGVDPDAQESQNVASLIFTPPSADPAPGDPGAGTDGLSPETVNLIEAIVQSAQGGVPQ